MKKLSLIIMAILLTALLYAQSPQSFQYQAVIRDATGLVIPDQNVGIRISILQGSVSGPSVYTETHSPTTNSFGLVNLEIGGGSVSSGDFTTIAWGDDLFFIKIELDQTGGTAYQLMGTSQLLSVPYALYAEKAGSAASGLWKISMNDIYYDEGNVRVGTGLVNSVGRLQVMSDTTATHNDVIFSVQNAAGDTVFAVYQEGVRIWVSEDTSGAKAIGSRGGFAVGGLSPAKTYGDEYFRVTPDSVRVYIKESSGIAATGSRGGFAVGGLSPAKGITDDYLFVNNDSTRIWTTDTVKGFGVKNIGASEKTSYLQMNPDNYFIGHESGNSNTFGRFNSFIGYQAGYSNISGNKNYFIGYRSGFNNNGGNSNIFIGDSAGFSNNSGYQNVFIGNSSGESNISGNFNVFLGYKAGMNNLVSFNVFVGSQAGYSNTSGISNVGVGFQTLYSNTIGFRNIAIGYSTLHSNTDGNYNTSTGWMSMYFNTTGDYNVAYGPSALYYNTGGSYNVATGYGALIQNTTGSNNTACGSESLYSNTTADFNTACGAQALYSCTTGASNSAFGVSALWNNSSGYNNVAVGTGALSNNTTGYCNTALGRNAFSFNSAYYNSTAIGYNAQVTSENMVRVGDNAVTSIGGQVGWTAFSDGRFKQDVAENVPGLDFILKLRPVTYHYDMDALAEFYHTPDSLRIPESEAIAGRILHTGFIAQEVEKSALESGYDFSGVDKPNNSGDHYGLRYAEFTVPLVKSVQELNAENESLKSEIQMLKSEIAILKDENKTLTKDNNEITLRIEKIENQLSNK